MPPKRWFKLDNAAKVYPATYRSYRNHIFRLSATLSEVIDKDVMQSALDVAVKRFPSIAVGLKRGLFWYYLESSTVTAKVEDEQSHPLTVMPKEMIRHCAFRVLVYQKRIAVEFFHSLTDGTGGLIFLKTLVAEYLEQKNGIYITPSNGVLDRHEQPKEEETEDSFQKNTGPVSKPRAEKKSFMIPGTVEKDRYVTATSLHYDVKEALAAAKAHGTTLTEYIGSALIWSVIKIQEETKRRRKKPVRIEVPVNVRPFFESTTLRNFSLYVNPTIDPNYGEWTFDEICNSVKHQMELSITKKEMAATITENIGSERSIFVRVMPLPFKNAAITLIFHLFGSNTTCLALSNLGQVTVPDDMKQYVKNFDFYLGANAESVYNCTMVSYDGELHVNFSRGIKEPKLEYIFYCLLRDEGLRASVESNQR